MEIRNRDDALFIIRNRASKEMGRKYKTIGRLVLWGAIPMVVYLFCIIGTYPNAGVNGNPDIPRGIVGGLLVLVVWWVAGALVAVSVHSKDKDLLVKKYMDEETAKGTIDKEEPAVK